MKTVILDKAVSPSKLVSATIYFVDGSTLSLDRLAKELGLSSEEEAITQNLWYTLHGQPVPDMITLCGVTFRVDKIVKVEWVF